MLYPSPIQIGGKPLPLAKGQIKRVLYSYLDSTIPSYCNWISNEDNWKKQKEDFYNQRLARFLNKERTNSCPFDFVHQSSQGKNRSLDIGVHISSDSGEAIIGIEGKRLPTGSDKKREKEYLYFDDPQKIYGAVERFKHHLHGINMSESIIIGYIQTGNINYWHSKINSWVDELEIQSSHPEISWAKEDKLKISSGFTCKNIGKFESVNSRLEGMQPIYLTHYLIQF